MRLAVLFALLLRMGGTVTDASAETPEWPALPTKGFIVGRPATQRDVADGNAVFSAEKNGKVIGAPLSIQIPQDALRDDGKGQKFPSSLSKLSRQTVLIWPVCATPKGTT
jgi:hypothetical protein